MTFIITSINNDHPAKTLDEGMTRIIHHHDAMHPRLYGYSENLQVKKKIMKTIVALAALLIPIMSFAHPGHGSTDGYNVIHYFIEPEHAVFTWTFVLLGVCLVSMYGVKKRKMNRSNPA